jgi:hypothetical protein
MIPLVVVIIPIFYVIYVSVPIFIFFVIAIDASFVVMVSTVGAEFGSTHIAFSNCISIFSTNGTKGHF